MNRFRHFFKRLVCEKIPLTRGSFRYYGTKVFFPPGSVMFDRICREEVYERENVNLICSLIRDGTCYLDIGANIGLMSIPVLYERPFANAISFEPSPNSYEFLIKTRELSPYRDRWQTIQKALGNSPGKVPFSARTPAQGAFDGLRDTGRGGTAKQTTVTVSTLDLEWEVLGCPEVSCLKIDTEGAELLVLEGGIECIRKNRPAILTEWSWRNLRAYGCDPDVLLTFAQRIGYGLYALPSLVRITTGSMLKLHCLRTESFLLFAD